MSSLGWGQTKGRQCAFGVCSQDFRTILFQIWAFTADWLTLLLPQGHTGVFHEQTMKLKSPIPPLPFSLNQQPFTASYVSRNLPSNSCIFVISIFVTSSPLDKVTGLESTLAPGHQCRLEFCILSLFSSNSLQRELDFSLSSVTEGL